MNAQDKVKVAWIRGICARELNSDPDYPFFGMDGIDGEDADERLLRLYNAERRHHDSDEHTVLVLCHG